MIQPSRPPHRGLAAASLLLALCMALTCLPLPWQAAGATQTDAVPPSATNTPLGAKPSGPASALELTAAEQGFLTAHPTLTVAYGKSWEPIIRLDPDGTPSGAAVALLRRLTDATGVALTYTSLQTAEQYDVLCCVPDDGALANLAGISLSDAYVSLPLVWVSRQPVGATPKSAAVSEGFALRLPEGSAGGTFRYYADGALCLNAVLDGQQPAALLNRYAALSLLRITSYRSLVMQRIQGAAANVCFGVRKGSDPLLLAILNKLIRATGSDDMGDILLSATLETPLTSIIPNMPGYDAIVPISLFLLLIILLSLILLRELRVRHEHARATEIAAFLDYANKANDIVWEVALHTRKRWRYQVQNGEILRIPMPALTEAIIGHYVHPDDLATVKAHMRIVENGAFIASEQQERFECRLLTDGETRYKWTRIVFQGITPNKEHPDSMMVYVMDVDNAIRSEEAKNKQLQAALEAAEAASIAKGRFTAYISHEIRSPLNAVLGYLTLARGSIGNPEQLTDCFVKSEYAANHLLQLINDVLDMGSIESGKMQIDSRSFDLLALLETLASIYNAQAKNRGICYQVEKGDLPEPYLLGDDLRVKQVLVNLLSNAMKFTPRGGNVTLRATQTGSDGDLAHICFQVTDTGVGMTEAFQKQLFNAYTQQDAGIAARFGGSGLGLNIVKNLTDLMGGTLTVASAPGQGTTFTVVLSFPVDITKKTLVEAQPDARVCFSGKRLLLAEDNDMNMEIATELLKQEGGFLIDGVPNGREALDRFTASPAGTYDAILMDVRMPGMDGYEATRAIRSSGHPDAERVPILAMTADAFAEDVQHARDAGMNGHIAKPIDIHHVLTTLSEVLLDP